jgi:general secretion pathway protein M
MNEWFAGLEQRERVTLIGAAAAAIVIALFVFVLRPLNARTALLKEDVAMKQLLLVDLARAEGVRGAARGVSPAESSMQVLAASTASQHNVVYDSIRADGADAVRVYFEDVPFDALAAWLVSLSNEHSVRVEQISANRREQGIVRGQVVLRRS